MIVPVHNGAEFLVECLESVLSQKCDRLSVELSIFDDASTDDSWRISKNYAAACLAGRHGNFRLLLRRSEAASAGGVGFGKNQAVQQSSGRFLCFLDADDVMLPHRIREQFALANQLPKLALVGAKYRRIPEGSTSRYTKWANNLNQQLLPVQVSHWLFLV